MPALLTKRNLLIAASVLLLSFSSSGGSSLGVDSSPGAAAPSVVEQNYINSNRSTPAGSVKNTRVPASKDKSDVIKPPSTVKPTQEYRYAKVTKTTNVQEDAVATGTVEAGYFDNSAAADWIDYTDSSDSCYGFTCSYNAYNCKDFVSHAQAQAVYECCYQKVGLDVHRLDRDKDGIACEALR